MIVLDTNVLSELVRPSPAIEVIRFVEDRRDSLTLTAVTVHEITYGLELLPQGRRRRQVSAMLGEFIESLSDDRILHLDESAARRSGLLRARRRALGRPMAIADSLIAGIVLEAGHSLATRNIADFDALGIDLIDPWAEAGA